MKKVLIVLSFILIAFTSKAQNLISDQQATKMLKDFYTSYISTLSGSGDLHIMENTLLLLRKKYCTKRCLIRYENLGEQTDADPIVKAQDGIPGDEKTIVVKNDAKIKDIYYVSYGRDKSTKTTIKLKLIEQNGALKIDYLW
jgi:hypothetical protein